MFLFIRKPSCNIEDHYPPMLLLIYTLFLKDFDISLEPHMIDDLRLGHSNDKSFGITFLLTQLIYNMNILSKGSWSMKVTANECFTLPNKHTISKQMISSLMGSIT